MACVGWILVWQICLNNDYEIEAYLLEAININILLQKLNLRMVFIAEYVFDVKKNFPCTTLQGIFVNGI